MEMAAAAAATKREREIKALEAGRKKAAGVVRTAKPDISWVMQDRVDELRLNRAVARLNKENPNAPPIVLEELTEEDRAALLQQEMEWVRKMEEVHSVQREADRLAKEAERARAPPPPPEDPRKDKWQLDYEFSREHLEMKLASEASFSGFSLEENTRIPAMCFTDHPMRDHTKTRSTLQIFTVKVAGLDEALQLPLDVFGMVAVHDKLDYSRNVIFSRTRDNYQTLTQQDPYLLLTGPSRAVFYSDKVYVDAVLKVKGTTESEDIDLSLLFQQFVCCEKMNLCVDVGECRLRSCVSSLLYTSKLSTLEFTCGLVASSVEATIAMQIVEGSWSEGVRCKFTACIGSLGHMVVLLLDSGEEEVVFAAADGTVELSRRIVSVESYGQLIVRGVVRRGDGEHGQILAEEIDWMGSQKFPAPVADLCDANASLILTGELRILEPIFQAYGQCTSFSGQVVTMRVLEHNVGVDELFQTPGEGRVLVLDGRGSKRCAIIGGHLADRACRSGWAGAVVNGCVRDVDDINACAIGVRALASHPRRPGQHGAAQMHVDVDIAGAVIVDGEWLYADSDGIIVCDKEIYG